MQTQSEIAIGRMPRFQKIIHLEAPSAPYFRALLDYLPRIGFNIEAMSEPLMRLCVRRPAPADECGCRYVIWIYGAGQRTRVVFGVQPRFLSFLFCGSGDVYEKLLGLEAHLKAAAQAPADIFPQPQNMIDQ